MSRFYASIQGSRGEATRQGTGKSGIAGHIRGWDLGVKVVGGPGPDGDEFLVYMTAGSNGGGQDLLVGKAEIDEHGQRVFRLLDRTGGPLASVGS